MVAVLSGVGTVGPARRGRRGYGLPVLDRPEPGPWVWASQALGP